MGNILFNSKKKCRTCGESSRFPVCKACASKKELQLIKEIETIDGEVLENNKRLYKSRLKFPKLTPHFFFSFILLWLFFTHSYLFSKFIGEPIVMVLIGALSLLFMIFAVYFWIDFPTENIRSGVEFMDKKHRNLILKRHRKFYLRLLKKPAENWTRLEQIKLNFETLEA